MSTNSDGKRRLSSDGNTPKPVQKSTKMAESPQESSGENPGVIDKLTVIAKAVQNLQAGQQSLKSTLESKLDKFRNEFISSIDEKFKAMRSDIDLELAVHKKDIDQLSQSIDSIVRRLDSIENQQCSGPSPQNVNSPLDDPNLTIIASNVTETHDEILDVVLDLVSKLDSTCCINVTAASRLNSRFGKPGLVKISFSSLEEKKAILREKRRLRDTEKYKNVYPRSSKSHTDSLIELNARTILNEIPNGRQFRITSNGRIVKKQNEIQRPLTDTHDDG